MSAASKGTLLAVKVSFGEGPCDYVNFLSGVNEKCGTRDGTRTWRRMLVLWTEIVSVIYVWPTRFLKFLDPMT